MQMEPDDFSNNCENNTQFTVRDLKMNLQSNADGPSVDFTVEKHLLKYFYKEDRKNIKQS